LICYSEIETQIVLNTVLKNMSESKRDVKSFIIRTVHVILLGCLHEIKIGMVEG